MSVLWSVLWGAAVFITMKITYRYYIPKLDGRIHENSLDTPPVSVEKRSEKQRKVSRKKEICCLIGCTVFSILCGYSASLYADSLMGMLKMILTMGVLGCVFITDMERMIIPNLCSVVLLVGRLILIVAELIFVPDSAMLWLINSVVALLVSILLLLIMSKVTHGGIGMGDVKLFGSIGFLCGLQAVCYTLVFAFFICAVVSSILLLTKKKHLKDALPLGPFVFLGFGISVLISII